jgi:hypothetical protein
MAPPSILDSRRRFGRRLRIGATPDSPRRPRHFAVEKSVGREGGIARLRETKAEPF